MDEIVIYITVPGKPAARRISRALVEKKLVACVNIVPGIESIYWWQQRIEKANECLLIAKTLRSRLKSLCDEVRRIHPYEVPEVTALPVSGGNPAYLRWIAESVGKIRRVRSQRP